MHNDETQQGAAWSGGSTPASDAAGAETRAAGQPVDYSAWHAERTDTPGNGGYTSYPPPAPYRSQPPYMSAPQTQPTMPAPSPKRSRSGWVGPLIVVLAAVVAFALVLFFTRTKDETPQAQPLNTVATQGAPSSAAGVPSSSSSSSTTTADFPSSGVDCSDRYAVTLGDSIRRDTSTTSTLSCGLIRNLGDATLEEIRNHPGVTGTFTVDNVPSPMSGVTHKYSATCDRENHLSTCTGDALHSGRYTYYVKDSVNP